MPSELALTCRALIAEGVALLQEAGITTARREALCIWSNLTGEVSAGLPLQPDAPADRGVSGAFLGAISRRAAGEPLPHVTGLVGFRRLTLRSDRRALIPRPETEGLVDLLLARVRTGRVADLGTGSGCIALSLATEGGFTEVVGVDLSSEALALAAENRGQIGAHVSLIQGDLCGPLRRGALDALVSNPPYLTAGEYAVLDPSVRDWEPRSALVSGEDGLGATTRILEEGRSLLHFGGWAALEVDCSRAAECARRAAALGWADVAIHWDLFGRERYLLARRSDTP